MQISLQEAYAEACRALGEQIVERRLLAAVEAADVTQPDATDEQGSAA